MIIAYKNTHLLIAEADKIIAFNSYYDDEEEYKPPSTLLETGKLMKRPYGLLLIAESIDTIQHSIGKMF